MLAAPCLVRLPVTNITCYLVILVAVEPHNGRYLIRSFSCCARKTCLYYGLQPHLYADDTHTHTHIYSLCRPGDNEQLQSRVSACASRTLDHGCGPTFIGQHGENGSIVVCVSSSAAPDSRRPVDGGFGPRSASPFSP